MSSKSERNSNIEILRIIAMVMIVGHHFMIYGVQQSFDLSIAGTVFSNGSILNKIFTSLILPGGVVGVAIFFLIAGYFGINSDKVIIHKITIPVIIYSVVGLFVYLLLNVINGRLLISKEFVKNCILSIFPNGSNLYWFTTAYIILTLMKPALNGIIRSLKIKYLIVIILFLLLEYIAIRQTMGSMLALVEAVFYYFVGALLSITKEKFLNVNRIYCFLCMCVGWLGYVMLTHIHFASLELIGITVFGSLAAVGTFEYCAKLNVENSSFINNVAILTFDVYLLHEHPLLRDQL